MIIFEVSYAMITGEDRADLAGRLCRGNLKIGTKFIAAFKYEPHGFEETTLQRIEEQKIDLIVERIVLYRRIVNELDEGLTGLVSVYGFGLNAISVEDVFIATC